MNSMDLTYRRSAAAGASGLGYLMALYDTLARDLHGAASAQLAGDLEQRTRQVKHALAVLAFLENWLDAERGALAQQLAVLYASVRRRLMLAQGRQSAKIFEDLMSEVLGIRAIWQQLESTTSAPAPQILPPVARQQHTKPYSPEPDHRQLSWSA